MSNKDAAWQRVSERQKMGGNTQPLQRSHDCDYEGCEAPQVADGFCEQHWSIYDAWSKDAGPCES